MATNSIYKCTKCGDESQTGSIFDSLSEVAADKVHPCGKCGAHCKLHLTFNFGLDATGADCDVLDAFLPDEPDKWKDNAGQEVTFYPFLVITDGEKEKGAWLPYWHVVIEDGKTEKKKYGQWAPFMDLPVFEALVAKARAKGYLK